MIRHPRPALPTHPCSPRLNVGLAVQQPCPSLAARHRLQHRKDPMTRLIALASLALLAACGADGPPQPPAPTGVTISGDAQIGIVSN